jgi:hypothetical protein
MEGAVGGLLGAYATAANEGKKVNREIALLTVTHLRQTAIGLDLVTQFLPAIPRDDKYAVRMIALRQIQQGAVRQFSTDEGILGERNYYGPDDLSMILAGMSEAAPTFIEAFPADVRAEMKRRLTKRRLEFTNREDQKRIDDMLKRLAE